MSEDWNESGGKSLWVAPDVLPAAVPQEADENPLPFWESAIKGMILLLVCIATGVCVLVMAILAWHQVLPWWLALAGFLIPLLWRATHRQFMGKDFASTVMMCVGVVAMSLWGASNLARSPKPGGQTAACRSNLKNIGTACEMYSTDYAGHYPPSLALLTPMYLKMIPDCPLAGQQTYSGTYTTAQLPDAFTVYCAGHYHKAANLGPNLPLFNSERGLLDR